MRENSKAFSSSVKVATDLVALNRQDTPLLLSFGFHLLAPARTRSILSRMSEYRDMDTSSLPPEKVDILNELHDVFQGNREAISLYLAKFGWSKVVATSLRIVRRELAERTQQSESGTEFSVPKHQDEHADKGDENELRSPFYEVEVTCPFCHARFTASVARGKALIMGLSYKNPDYPLLVPESVSAMKGYRLEDPLQKFVVVCPQCLYASSSLGNFQSDSALAGARGLMARIPDRKMHHLAEAIASTRNERQEICAPLLAKSSEPQAPGLVFQRPTRTPAQLIVSFRLAAASETLLGDYDVMQYYKASESMLCAAKVSWSEKDGVSEERYLSEAFRLVEKCFQLGSSAALPVYILGVLSWHMGDPKVSRSWIGQILTDRGKLNGALRYKRYCENLNEEIRARL